MSDQSGSEPRKRGWSIGDPPKLTEKKGEAMRSRIRRWSRREMWRLWEACDLAFHVPPVEGLRHLWYWPSIESDDLCDRAIRAVHANILEVKPAKQEKDSWVAKVVRRFLDR